MTTDIDTKDTHLEGKTNHIPSSFTRRVLIAAGIIITLLLVLLLLWYAVDVLMLVFTGILMAIFLRGLSDKLSERIGLSSGWSLAVVCLALVALISLGGWLLAPSIAEQVDQLSETVPRSVARLQQSITRYGWGRRLLEQVPPIEDMMPRTRDVVSRATGVFSTTLGVVANLFIVLFIGLYLAADPRLYTGGLLHLVPLKKRQRASEVVETLGYTLRWWLIGTAASMLVVGVLTWTGLWLLGVPLALTLAIIAALLTFIPNIGPIIAVIPAALFAFVDSPMTALYVLLLYLGIQTVESYFFTPLVQKSTIDLPPALTIAAQVLLGVLLGTLGLVIATPLTAATLVLIKMLYVEDALGDSLEVPGEPKTASLTTQ
ncbi:MAG: AI-2E family transporter [Acidobacteriota bacterium]|nr:AI-2E family transporter [Acidobacteriota bacterium]